MNEKQQKLGSFVQFYRLHQRRIKLYSAFTAISGIGWFIYQVHETKEKLVRAIDNSILEIFEPHTVERTLDDQVLCGYSNWIKPCETALNKSSNFFKFMYARRLLNLAISEMPMLRNRAIEHLAKINNLDNWQYSLIAHMCDARAAVGIARTIGTDQRLFLQPPRKFGLYNNQMLLNKMQDYLLALNSACKSEHPCIENFISTAFFDLHDVSRIFDPDHGNEEITKYVKSSMNILPLCLESIRHHSSITKYVNDIVTHNGLYLLMEIYKRYSNDSSINIALSNILANISISPILLQEIFKSGWISVLSSWVKAPDIRLSGPAAQALANLDYDDNSKKVLAGNVYILHPIHRSTERIAVDVVFIHGLLGGVFYTWRKRDKNTSNTIGLIGKKIKETVTESITQESNKRLENSSDPGTREYLEELRDDEQASWVSIGHDFEYVMYDIPDENITNNDGPYTLPKTDRSMLYDVDKPTQCWARDWLPIDCLHLRVIGINYDTKISMWAQMCPELSQRTNLESRTTELMNTLVMAGLGTRPIVWVAHSMGGLLVKNLLTKAYKSNSENVRNLCLNTKACVFYSTPHRGSKTATLNQPTSYLIWPSVEVRELAENSPHLAKLHKEFLDVYNKVPMKVVSFLENNATVISALKLNLFLVEPWSGDPGIGELYKIPADHLSICKPANRQSFLYQRTLAIIREVVEEEVSN